LKGGVPDSTLDDFVREASSALRRHFKKPENKINAEPSFALAA
jgi:hypothetical protein